MRFSPLLAALALCVLSAQSAAAAESPFDVIRSFVEKKVEALDALKKKAALRKTPAAKPAAAPAAAGKDVPPAKAAAATSAPAAGKATLKPPSKSEAAAPTPEAAPRKAEDDTADDVPVPRRRPAFPVAAAALIAPGGGLAPKAASGKRLAPATAPVIEASLPPAASEGKSEAPEGEGSGTLVALGVTSVPLPPISKGACVVPAPILVSAFGNGTIKLSAKATTNAAMAKAMAGWLHDDVIPAAADLGGRLTALEIAASYDCRNRDGLPDAKLSEHAFADAIDIPGFQISGKGWIEVGGSHPSDAQKFLDRIRKAACGPFTTVLGPGSDSYHANHFHLDLAKRRTAGPSKGLFCQ